MMKKLMGMGVLVGFLFSILMATGAFAAAAAPKDTIVFDVSQGKVTFTHKKHAETLKIDCLKCHHTWKKGETSGQTCDDCHKAKAEGKTLALKDALHKDCQGCHNELKKASKPAGPTVCTQCHIKAAKK
jgi:hypothetical protein